MKCARQLFPHSEKQAELWAIYCYDRWINGGPSPEEQRNRRNPRWKDSIELFEKRRKKTKVLYYP